MLRGVAFLALVPAFAQVSLVFNQSEEYSIYDSASVTRHSPAVPSFAFSSSLNPPEFIESYSENGTLLWSFNAGPGTYLSDSARHAGNDPGNDIFGRNSN